ncbi:MAG: NAD(P)-dependent oxidoreductase [Cellvibrio sp.]
MKVALIGGTGFVGSAILSELLDRGHEVTALVRDPNKLEKRDRLHSVKIDVTDVAGVAGAVRGNQAVISAFNAGWTNPNIYKDFMTGSRAIQAGVKRAGVNRFIVVGGAGSLYDEDGNQLVDSPQFPKDIYDGANAARHYFDELQRERDLEWTFLSPPVGFGPASPKARLGKYRTGTDKPLKTDGGVGQISAADLAVAVVDELEFPYHVRERFTVAY